MTDPRQNAYAEGRRLYREAVASIRYVCPTGSPTTNIDPALKVSEPVTSDPIMGEMK